MMESPKGYTDLNIRNGPNAQSICQTAIRLGYKILAINTTVLARNVASGQGGNASSKKQAKKRKLEANSSATITVQSIPVPDEAEEVWIKKLMDDNPGVRILRRVTYIFNGVNELQIALSHANTKLYDLVGVIPSNHEAMQGCIVSTSLVFDIISFDFEGPFWINKLKLNRTKGVLAGEKGIFFELTYASSLHGDSPCENMIYIGNCLLEDVCVKRIKNMIISSGAKSSIEIRKPKDVLSMGYLLGLDETTARNCIREYTHRIITKADLRKYGKTWVAFIPNPSSKESTQDQKDLSVFPNTSSKMDVEEEKS